MAPERRRCKFCSQHNQKSGIHQKVKNNQKFVQKLTEPTIPVNNDIDPVNNDIDKNGAAA